ncbi:MAG: 3-phosphoshikimate 1-carboxyvinyltransferase [Verrucomicrobiota bacterium]|nr:3-phosphoshikimate 1-carboxyvinyltransferase [Verrucomicrobiota bacterium]
MPLPELIEIVPVRRLVRAEVTVPGSKSITNRALVLAALGSGMTVLRNALWSEDTQVMVEALRALGIDVDVAADSHEKCNRTITVRGCDGRLPMGPGAEPVDLYVGNAGTAARFLTALACLGRGRYRLHGTDRMHQRPQSGLFKALRSIGYRIESSNDRLPAIVHGSGPRPGRCRVEVAESSQFASALLLAGTAGQWTVEIAGSESAEEQGYIEMTRRMIECFPKAGGEFVVEPDASSGSYFVGAGWLLATSDAVQTSGLHTGTVRFTLREENAKLVAVKDWPKTDWQLDARFPKYVPIPREVSRARDLGDAIMTAIVLAADSDSGRTWALDRDCPGVYVSGEGCDRPALFTQLGRLRLQECERVAGLRTELQKCGAKVVESGDAFEVWPSKLHAAEIETYNDHRMAMCFSILGLKVPGLKIKNPACVKKTFPDFYVKLAQPEPAGLGATILDARSKRVVGVDDLIAE